MGAEQLVKAMINLGLVYPISTQSPGLLFPLFLEDKQFDPQDNGFEQLLTFQFAGE